MKGSPLGWWNGRAALLFLVEGHPGYDAICTWIASSVCLVGYFVLIPPFGVWGAAAATTVAFLVLSGIAVVWTYRLRPYRVEAARLGKVGLALAAVSVPYATIPVSGLPAR
jgi:O-antigen/teichoic acid export membrane protein